MERINRQLAEALRAFLVLRRQADGTYVLPDHISCDALIGIAKKALKDELAFYPVADDLIWTVARHEGYVIPTTPVESRGDTREFLKEHNVQNSKEWYKKRGFSPRQVRSLFTTSAFMARNAGFWRKILPLEKRETENVNRLTPTLLQAIDFCLENREGREDATLFKI